MRTVTAMDMRKRLGEILDAASAGERILIERDHRPLAYLVSVEDGQRLNPDQDERVRRRLAALDRLAAHGREMARKYPAPDDGLTDAEWIRRDHERRAERIDRAARGLPPPEDD
jgi:prevent-host-death family protein